MEDCSPPEKVKKALVGPSKCQSRFRKKWEKFCPISSVPNSPAEFRCAVGGHIVSCSHQDEADHDVKRHIQGSINQKKLKRLKSMKTLSSFGFRPNDDSSGSRYANYVI